MPRESFVIGLAKPRAVFASTNDPGYVALLGLCAGGHKQLEQVKRFDMPGFHPRLDWVREMKRYGILAAETPVDTIDVYQAERAYWRSFWHVPPGK